MKYLSIFVLLFIGCKVTNDNRAVSRVIASTDLSNRAYAILVKQHPISIDTVYRMINGKPVITYDTVEKPTFYTDTVIDLQPGKIKNVTQVVTKYITSTDTILKTVTDSRLLDASNTQVTKISTELQASKDSDAVHKRAKTYWVIAACVSFLLFLLMIVILLKRK